MVAAFLVDAEPFLVFCSRSSVLSLLPGCVNLQPACVVICSCIEWFEFKVSSVLVGKTTVLFMHLTWTLLLKYSTLVHMPFLFPAVCGVGFFCVLYCIFLFLFSSLHFCVKKWVAV